MLLIPNDSYISNLPATEKLLVNSFSEDYFLKITGKLDPNIKIIQSQNTAKWKFSLYACVNIYSHINNVHDKCKTKKTNHQVCHLGLPGNNIKSIIKKMVKVTQTGYKLNKI